MAFISFEQAPDLPTGAGIFTTDTGQKTPLVYMPQEAAQLADNSAGAQLPPSVGAALAGGAQPVVPPSASDATGPLIPKGATLGPIASSDAGLGMKPPGEAAPAGTLDRISAATGIATPISSQNPPAPPPKLGGAPVPAATGGGPSGPNDMALANAFVAPSAHAGGGASHFQKSLTHEVTPSLSPENLQATQDALKASADVQAENIKRESDTQAHLAVNKSAEAAIARDEAEKERQRLAKATDAHNNAQAEWSAAMKEDPTDVWHGNTFAHVLAIIGQSLGAYGASITHTDNWAAKEIATLTEQNVRVQMAKRQGLYQRLRDLGQDEDQARNGVRVASLDAAQREAEQFAAHSADVKAQGQAAQVAADLGKQKQAVINDNQMAEQGKTSVTTATSGSSGGAGGGDRIAEMVKRRQQWVALGRDPADFDKAAGFAAGKGEDEAQTAAELRLKTPARNVLDTIQNNGPKFGLVVDPTTGEWKQSAGSALSAQVPFTTAKHAKETMVNALAPEMVKLRTGGEGDDKARTAAAEELRALSPEQFAMTLNQLSRNARHILGTKIYHGKNQVPGNDGSGDQ